MIFALLFITAEIKDLKQQERSLLDTIDDLVDERRQVDKRLKTIQRELVSLSQMTDAQRAQLAEDKKAHEAAAREARGRARMLARIVRGQGARFVLGADGFAEGVRRMQLMQRVLRRDWLVLRRAVDAVDDQRERVNTLERNEQYANDMSEALASLKLQALEKTAELNQALLEVRAQRAQEERSFYDLKEIEATLKREEEEERVAASDPFSSLRGRMRWPVHGPISKHFGAYNEPTSGLEVARSGVRIKAAPGTNVMSVAPGTVRHVDAVPGYGRVVIVQHSDNYFGVYGGLADTRVTKGATVAESQPLGPISGEDALRGGAYFEVRRKTTAENPLEWLTQ